MGCRNKLHYVFTGKHPAAETSPDIELPFLWGYIGLLANWLTVVGELQKGLPALLYELLMLRSYHVRGFGSQGVVFLQAMYSDKLKLCLLACPTW